MKLKNIITQACKERRKLWVAKIAALRGDFQDCAASIKHDLEQEIASEGIDALLDHVRCASAIPESYGHDSTEEKLYAKYTDTILSVSYSMLGMHSQLLDGRGDAADVEVLASEYAFVADAKSFRLSRTAKNQKDFKVVALDNWKQGKPYAMLVAPLYQLPKRKSQIYRQAITYNVCIFSYAHLAVVLSFAHQAGNQHGTALIQKIFQSIHSLQPSDKAQLYWETVNKAMLQFDTRIKALWYTEKIATKKFISFVKNEALAYIAQERERIMRLTHVAALEELLTLHRMDSRKDTINSIKANNFMDI